jgi:hypothetical protein
MTMRLILATSCGLALAGTPAQASCIPATERDQLRRADAVFVGRVLSVRRSDGRATFRVLSVRKGRRRIHRGSAVRVYGEPYPSSVTIGWPPRVGERWKVYVDRRGRRWTTNDCMGTRRVSSG